MEKSESTTIISFVKELPNDDKYKEYLAKYKWQDGFKCSKWQSAKRCMKKGFKYYCYACHHVESATANTLFTRLNLACRKLSVYFF